MFDLNHDNFILHTIFQTISIQKIYNKFTKNHSTKIIGREQKQKYKVPKRNFNETSIPAKQKI